MAVGKTELIYEFADRVREMPCVTLVAGGSEAERTLWLGVVAQLAQSDDIDEADRRRLQELLRLTEDGRDGPVDADPVGAVSGSPQIRPSHARLAQELCGVLQALAKSQPVVVAIDDLHLVDTPSLHVLLYLIRRIRRSRILVLVANAEQLGQSRRRIRTEIIRHRPRLITLGPLTESGVIELSERRPGITRAVDAPAVLQATDGNPLLVNALLDDQLTCDAIGDAPRPGPVFVEAALVMLQRLEGWVLEVAQAAAALGGAATPALVERLSGRDVDTCHRALQTLAACGLTVRGRFRVEAVGAALLRSTPAAVRGPLQLVAAEVVHRAGRPAAETARLLIEADVVPGPWAVSVLRDAARDAVASNDTEEAIRRLGLALRAGVERAERYSIAVELADLESIRNPAAAALRLDQLTEPLFAGELTGAEGARVVRHLVWQGDRERAEQALTMLEGTLDPDRAAELQLVVRAAFGTPVARPESRREPELWPDQAPREATPREGAPRGSAIVASPWSCATAALSSSIYRASRDEIVIGANHLLASMRPGLSSFEVAAAALYCLVFCEKLDAAAARCEPLIEEATARDATNWLAVLSGVRAEIALRRGDLLTAEARARAALAVMPACGWGIYIGNPLATLITASTAMGSRAAAAEAARHGPYPRIVDTGWSITRRTAA